MRGFGASLLCAALIAACADVLPFVPTDATSTVRDDRFELTVTSPSDRYSAAQPIEIEAAVTYLGPNVTESVFHGASPVGWRIVQVDGDAILRAAMAEPCLSSEMVAGTPVPYPFVKAGVADEAGPFERAWFDREELSLPPGRWRIIATLAVSLDECGGESHDLEAALEVDVRP